MHRQFPPVPRAPTLILLFSSVHVAPALSVRNTCEPVRPQVSQK